MAGTQKIGPEGGGGRSETAETAREDHEHRRPPRRSTSLGVDIRPLLGIPGSRGLRGAGWRVISQFHGFVVGIVVGACMEENGENSRIYLTGAT